MPYKDPAARKLYVTDFSRRPAQRENQRVYRAQHPEKSRSTYAPKRRSMLKRRYGITDAQYAAILLAQGGGCAVCQTTVPGNGKGDNFFDVDHDHVTGAIRGLLCRRCNVTAGVLERNRERIAKIEVYLARGVQ